MSTDFGITLKDLGGACLCRLPVSSSLVDLHFSAQIHSDPQSWPKSLSARLFSSSRKIALSTLPVWPGCEADVSERAKRSFVAVLAPQSRNPYRSGFA